jgi:hypothetical protein
VIYAQLNDAVDQQTLLRDQATLRFNKIDFERKQTLLAVRSSAQCS